MKTIELSDGYLTIVDDEDYEYLNQFNWQHSNYACRGIRINKKLTVIQMHRVIMNAPKGMVVDHINHNKLDNRRSNLRIVTTAENNHTANYTGNHKHRTMPER